MNKNKLNIRWFYLVIGVIAMLFAGVLYAWSILKSPLTSEFGWGASQLALNFTLAMSFFCIGGLLGAQISKRLGHRIALIIAGILSDDTRTLDTLNEVLAKLGNVEHIYNSKLIAGRLLNKKATELGCKYDKLSKAYVNA